MRRLTRRHRRGGRAGEGAGRVRLSCALLALFLTAGSLGACSNSGRAGGKPLVLTTFTVVKDMAQAIAGDRLQVESITSPDEEIHDFQPSPEDVRRGAKADLIVDNGLGLERWITKLTTNSKAKRVTLSDGVTPIPIASGGHAGEPNPHAWMSPREGKKYVDNLVKAFSALDREHAAEFKANGEAYKAKLDAISNEMTATLASVPREKRALVTCEGAFSYLARDFGLEERYLWAVNAEGALTPKGVAEVENFVKSRKIPAVFCESTVEGKMKPIVESTDAVYGGTLYVDSLSKAGGPVPSYLDLLRYDSQKIARGLARKGS